jgi:hypothetical protein
MAQALTCGSAGRINALYPSWPFRAPAGSDIWQLCASAACEPPQLEVAGVELALSEVDRRAATQLGTEWGDGKWLVRYRPSEALAPGVDNYLNPATGGQPFEVVSDEEGPPGPPPRLLGIAYEDHVFTGTGYTPLAASFYLELDDRMLVVDVGEPDEDPLQNLVFEDTFTVPFETTNPGALLYRLGTTECLSTFLEAAPGVTTQARFAFIDGRGRFSGWTGFYAVEFPEVGDRIWIESPDPISPPEPLVTDTDPTATRAASGCAVITSRAGSASIWWIAALVPGLVGLLRRRRLQ